MRKQVWNYKKIKHCLPWNALEVRNELCCRYTKLNCRLKRKKLFVRLLIGFVEIKKKTNWKWMKYVNISMSVCKQHTPLLMHLEPVIFFWVFKYSVAVLSMWVCLHVYAYDTLAYECDHTHTHSHVNTNTRTFTKTHKALFSSTYAECVHRRKVTHSHLDVFGTMERMCKSKIVGARYN